MQFEQSDGKNFKIELPDAKEGLTMVEVQTFTEDILKKSILDRSVESFVEAYLLSIERQNIQ